MDKKLTKYLVLDTCVDNCYKEQTYKIISPFKTEEEALRLVGLLTKIIELDYSNNIKVLVYNENAEDKDVIEYGRDIASYDKAKRRFIMSDCLNW